MFFSLSCVDNLFTNIHRAKIGANPCQHSLRRSAKAPKTARKSRTWSATSGSDQNHDKIYSKALPDENLLLFTPVTRLKALYGLGLSFCHRNGDGGKCPICVLTTVFQIRSITGFLGLAYKSSRVWSLPVIG